MSFEFFGFPFHHNLTPEQQAELEAKHQREEMKLDEFRHGFQRLFEELDLDQLQTLRTMLHIIVDGTNSILASGWEGMVLQIMKQRFGICITCGVNHEEELQKPEQELGPTLLEYRTDIRKVEDIHLPKFEDERPTFDEDEVLPTFHELTEQEIELCVKYHLDDLRVEETNELVGFICTGIEGMNGPCGMQYPSIQDRMMREPEHCSGCFQKMAHG